MATKATSYRLNPEVKARLERRAAEEGISERALLERLISEGIDVLEHPAVYYKEGRAGRRAALRAGGDIWAIASALRYTEGTEQERVAELADQFNVLPRDIHEALDFYAAHQEAIDAEVRANDEAAERLERLSRQRAGLLAG